MSEDLHRTGAGNGKGFEICQEIRWGHTISSCSAVGKICLVRTQRMVGKWCLNPRAEVWSSKDTEVLAFTRAMKTKKSNSTFSCRILRPWNRTTQNVYDDYPNCISLMLMPRFTGHILEDRGRKIGTVKPYICMSEKRSKSGMVLKSSVSYPILHIGWNELPAASGYFSLQLSSDLNVPDPKLIHISTSSGLILGDFLALLLEPYSQNIGYHS